MPRDIVFSLEYRCWPLWRYDKNDFLIDNCTPPEWEDDLELDATLRALTRAYDAFFIDENGKEDFTSTDNSTEEQRLAFKALLKRAKELIAKNNNGEHYIEYLD